MDRTILVAQRAEERELGDRLHQLLQGLILLHPASDDLIKCLSEETFLKPNQPAFFLVMHYLFNLLDPVEFKKRFYWPITDKRGEAVFRTSTVDYLNHLNEKHQLQWGNIKLYVIVNPGGKKFILFLLELISFVVHEQIKVHERQLSAEMEMKEFSDLNLRRMRRQNELFKEYASAYITQMGEQLAKYRKEIGILQQHMKTLSETTGISVEQLIDEEWLQKYAQENEELFEKRYCQRVAAIVELEQPLVELKRVVDGFQTREAELKFDKTSVRQALQSIRQLFHKEEANEEGRQQDTVVTPTGDSADNDIGLLELVEAFNDIAPMLQNMLSDCQALPNCDDFVIEELTTLREELQQIEKQITEFQKMLSQQQRQHKEQKRMPTLSMHRGEHNKENEALLLKFVHTPPIKLDMCGDERVAKLRLPLLDGTNAKQNDTINSFLTIPRSARKKRASDCSMDLKNTTLNRSRIMDPIQLLRTISKDTVKVHKVAHSSKVSMDTKWRQRQQLLCTDLEMPSMENKGASLCGSPSTPFNTQDRTTIARHKLLDVLHTSSGSGGASSTSVGSKVIALARKVAAVQKVQNDSLNIANMSTSPSGRLDALVVMELRDTPRLTVNDVSMQEETIRVNASLNEGGFVEEVEVLQTSFATRLSLGAVEPHTSVAAVDEDDFENIFDTSDSVLKDVI